MELAGESVESKIKRVREGMSASGADSLLVNALDQVAWLTNLRGGDIECNPVFFAYLAITQQEVRLFLQGEAMGSGTMSMLVEHFKEADVILEEYSAFYSTLVKTKLGVCMLEKSTCSLAMRSALQVEDEALMVDASPIEIFKARKNEVELAGIREASMKDSAAICKYLAWLEQVGLKAGAAPLSEYEVAGVLRKFRLADEACLGESFPTISSSGKNAAIVHYHATESDCDIVDPKKIYLCDTGGHYREGTTDITRTIHLGEPTTEEKRCFTRVLQGHIALAAAKFPMGTTGLQLDMLARAPLWQDGLEYGHGTGHGIGAYLNVHEGPMGIGGGSVPGSTIAKSERMRRVYLCGMEPGMHLSNEPGFYKAGEFGMRLESDIAVVEAETEFNFGSRPWLKFDYLTMVPISLALLEPSLMHEGEIKWLNDYHEAVRKAIAPRLEVLKQAGGVEGESGLCLAGWLDAATAPVRR